MTETIYSKIINHEAPAEIVYEDADILGFLDISPTNPGDTLVIPKIQSRNIFDIDSETWSKLMEAVRIIAPAVKAATNSTGVNILMNNEISAGQLIFHTHIHIIPRNDSDDVPNWPNTNYKEGEMKKMAVKIREAMTVD